MFFCKTAKLLILSQSFRYSEDIFVLQLPVFIFYLQSSRILYSLFLFNTKHLAKKTDLSIMHLLSSLLELDQAAFYVINTEWTSSALDWILPVWREKLFWIPVYFFIVSFMVINYRKKGYWFIVFMLLTVGTADLVSNELVKKTVERLRPCREPSMTEERVLVTCGSGYSFTSNHAANHFAISMFLIFTLGLRFRWVVPAALFWAFSISYGQVYVGVHYPLDVICGGILGTLIAYLGSYLYSISGSRQINWKVS